MRQVLTTILALTLGALPVGLLGCAALGKVAPYPSASIEDVDVGGFSLTSVTLTFDVAVKNPYSTDLPVVGLDYALSSGGNEFLSGEFSGGQVIPPGESVTIPMPVKLPFNALRKVGASISPGAKIPYRADLAIRVDAPLVGAIRIPTNQEGELAIPRLP